MGIKRILALRGGFKIFVDRPLLLGNRWPTPKDTFTFLGRNFLSGESDEFFVWWRKFCPTKFCLTDLKYSHLLIWNTALRVYWSNLLHDHWSNSTYGLLSLNYRSILPNWKSKDRILEQVSLWCTALLDFPYHQGSWQRPCL